MSPPSHPRTRRRDGERAASLVEFALIVPVLALILLGMVTGGLALATKNSMSNAVREGARTGATLPGSGDWNTWATLTRDRVLDLAGSDLDPGEVCVQAVHVTNSGETVLGSWPTSGCSLSMATPATPSTTATGSCVVKVWAEREADLNALVFTRTLSLTAKAVGQYERSECP